MDDISLKKNIWESTFWARVLILLKSLLNPCSLVSSSLSTFCVCNDLVVTNTLLMKPTLGLATFRGTQVPVENNETECSFADEGRLAQIDFILVSRPWKDAGLDCTSIPSANVDSDHFPVVCVSKVKFAARVRENRRNVQFWDTAEESTAKAFNCKATELVKGTEPGLVCLMKALETAAGDVPQIVKGKKERLVSRKTQELIKIRGELRNNGQIQLAAETSKQIQSSIRLDRRAEIVRDTGKLGCEGQVAWAKNVKEELCSEKVREK